MRTTRSTSGTTGRTRRAPVATTLAALCLAIPMVAAFGGTAFAAVDNGASNASNGDHGNSAAAQAAAAAKKADATSADVTPAAFIGPVAPAVTTPPYTNQGGVTTGANTTSYETVADQKGSTFTGVGGGQPSGDITKPQPFSNADSNNTGANDTSATNQYRSTRNGATSLNGNGGGKQTGQPCAGCVGKADNKNPPGQAPNGTDHNAGYECDRNHGIGRSNPAHTGCQTTVTRCVPTAGQDSNCQPQKCVPTAGQDSNCQPIHTCVPTAGQDGNCQPQKCVPTAGQDSNCQTQKCVPVGSQDSSCSPPKDCLGVVNGTATAAMCTPPLTGGGGGPATGSTTPVTGRTVTPVTQVTTPAAGTTPAPGTALPFTGSNTALLLRTGLLTLLVGTGLMLATRKPRPALARL
ncbi:MAG: hypothetical protein JWO88_2482 [Frankiales bacterium]|nr:hypothetical protein [Frankiales bacterium]